jgi:hypothetical protein
LEANAFFLSAILSGGQPQLNSFNKLEGNQKPAMKNPIFQIKFEKFIYKGG